MKFSHLKYVFVYILCAVLIFGTVYTFSYRNNLNQLNQTGSVRIEQAHDRILGQLASFRQLPNFLAKHPFVIAAINGNDPANQTNEFLLNTALISGATNIFILNKAGLAIASSNFTQSHNYIGNDYTLSPHVQAALNRRLGFFHALEPNETRRYFYYARSIIDNNAQHAGVVIIQIDVAALEFEWRVDEEILAFFDSDGVAFVTNRQSLSLLRDVPDQNAPTDTRHYAKQSLRPFFKHEKTNLYGHNIWNFKSDIIMPPQALIITRPIPQIGMTARIFLSTKSAKTDAGLLALLIAALLALIGVVFWVLFQRRQRLADLLAIEEEANATLEARVEKRTKQLRNTQHQLVQAGKLTALGQMSAGISHELNQPLAAIQNFAESGGKFIDRGREEDARNNFTLITQQIDRMSRIIRSLRAFARKEKETIEPVDLQIVIAESLNLASAQYTRESVEIRRSGLESPVFVMGGHIRLQQVIINLITNAIDAMVLQTSKVIQINLSHHNNDVHLTIRDNGSGFEDATRVFEPFYSTKEIGASKGMGLGLSISYGIIGTFGGDIICQNAQNGGAEFTVILKSTQQKRHT